MKTKKLFFATFIILVLFWGCEKKDSIIQKDSATDKTSPTLEQPENRNSSPKIQNSSFKDQNIKTDNSKDETLPDITQQRMIIRTGTMEMEVDKFDESEIKFKEVVKKFGGYIANSNSSQRSNGKKYGTIELKVPADKYDAMILEINSFGKVISQKINSNDITSEYVDLESRLKTQKELEQRLLKLLNEKAVKLSDVIEVEEKLASVRQKIEGFEGRMKMLKSQSDLSTLTVTYSEQSLLDTSSGGGFWYEIGQAIKKGLSGFTSVLTVSITILIALIPIIIFVLIVIWIIKRIINKKRKQNNI